jgi:hypothetical protein
MFSTPAFFLQLVKRVSLAALLCAALLPQVPRAESPVVTEYHVKAAFLYNFSRFVNWPQAIEQTFRICVIGENPFGDLLDPLIGKSVHDSVLVVEEHSTLENIHECQLAYISPSLEKQIDAVLTELKKHPILTVSDINGFTHAGGMIELNLNGKKVSFAINTNAADTAGLSISSKLLSLATNVTAGR